MTHQRFRSATLSVSLRDDDQEHQQPTSDSSFSDVVAGRAAEGATAHLGGAVVERWTPDRKVAGSTPGRGAIKSARSTQPSTLNFSLSEDFILVGKLSQKKKHRQEGNFQTEIQKTWLD